MLAYRLEAECHSDVTIRYRAVCAVKVVVNRIFLARHRVLRDHSILALVIPVPYGLARVYWLSGASTI